MRTGQWKTMGIGSLIGKMIYAVFGLAASMLCIMGYYPVVPAFYTACCLDKKRNFLLYIGLVVGMGWCMPVAAIVKYLFILFVLGIAIRFYIWANRRCSGWTAGMIAGITTIAMNTSGLLILNMEKKALILGISEGVIVFALAVLFHYGIGMGSQIFRERHKNRVEEEGVETMVGMDPQGRIHAFAEAVDELSVAFSAMDGRQKPKQQDHLDILAQEITGKLCADCDGCVVCLEQQKPDFWIKIRRMLQAVAQHSTKEEILSQNFMEECPRYSGMVEEAIWAFSRMELNEAWYHRLQENRKVIADQLDAMADALQDWDQGIRCMDRTRACSAGKNCV